MNVFIVYCHPSNNSFTYMAKEEFIRGLQDGGHSYEISDLYEMNFNSDISEEEYLREGFYNEGKTLGNDVLMEQKKIQDADIIAFIYPVFWTEAPAKLVGWFDRVWTYGFSYGDNARIKQLNNAIFIASVGNTIETLRERGQLEAMKSVMIRDRINSRAKEKEIIFLDGTSRGDMELRESNIRRHLQTVYNLGKNLV